MDLPTQKDKGSPALIGVCFFQVTSEIKSLWRFQERRDILETLMEKPHFSLSRLPLFRGFLRIRPCRIMLICAKK